MAGQYLYSVQTGSVALSASATKSLWLLNPVTNPITICEFSVSSDGSSAQTAVRVDLYVATTIGSPAGTAGTVAKWSDQSLPAATTTALTALTAEPTTVTVLWSWFLTPFGGLLDIQYPLGREPGTAGGATTNRLGLRCVTPAAVAPNVVADVLISEG